MAVAFGVLLTSAMQAKAQTKDGVYTKVENMPQYPEGIEALSKFVQAHLSYPEKEKKNGTAGVVMVTFVVRKDGSVSDVNVLKGVSDALDNEAVRVVKKFPRWHPGDIGGKPVDVQMVLPVQFAL